MSKVLALDGNNLAMRSMFAMSRSGLSDDQGVPTGALLSFVNTFSKYIREEKPTHVVVAWDTGSSERREAIDVGYKANRNSKPTQTHAAFSLVHDFLALSNIYQIRRTGLEADDLIAFYWRKRKVDDEFVILSSDKDFLQLLDTGVEQIRFSSAGTDTDRWTKERFCQAYGFLPEQMPYVHAMMGDTSDNVLGIPGIGPKKAAKIMEDSGWDWNQALGNKKVTQWADLVSKNLELVDLRSEREVLRVDPNLPRFAPTDASSPMFVQLVAFLDSHQMSRIKSHLMLGTLWA